MEFYELQLFQHVAETKKGGKSRDVARYCKTIDSYEEATKVAEECSKHIGEIDVCGYKLDSVKHLNIKQGLTGVKIFCYAKGTTENMIEITIPVFEESFENGKSIEIIKYYGEYCCKKSTRNH